MLPSVYIFNPSSDFAIANGSPTWQPGKLLKKMEYDLATLPVFIASEGDYVLTERMPSGAFLDRISVLGVHHRRFLTSRDLNRFTENIYRLNPWGWNPAIHKLLDPLKKSCSAEFKSSPVFNWKTEQKRLSSRAFSAGLLARFIANHPEKYLMEYGDLPVKCNCRTDVENQIIKRCSLMLKAPWSSSGRGLQKITKAPVHEAVWQRVNSIIKDQGFVMAEPYFRGQMDFAFEFSALKGEICYLGTSIFRTDSKGQYQGNFLNGPGNQLPEKVYAFFRKHSENLIDWLKIHLEISGLTKFYEGMLGIDGLVYMDSENQLRINPVLEINLRYTMGIVALNLEKYVGAESHGLFNLYYQPGKGFSVFAAEMTMVHPLVFRDNKIYSGFFPLTDFDEDSWFGAYLMIEKENGCITNPYAAVAITNI